MKRSVKYGFRSEDLIISESMTQGFGITGVLGKQAHSRLRNCFYSATVASKDKSDSGIIESSLLNPRKISCSQFLAQAIDSTALPKNAHLTYG